MSHWQTIKEFPSYVVNEYGVIQHKRRGTEVKARLNNEGFLMVSLMQGSEQLTRSVAIIVAEHFLDDPDNDAMNSIIHLNGEREDCRAVNLMWRPRWFAIRYQNMFKEEPYRVAVYVPVLRRRFASLREFCTTYGVIEKQAYSAMLNGDPCPTVGWILERR